MIRFNYVVLDTETSGLDPYSNAITQIAAIDSSGREFSEHVIPFNGCSYSAKAMEMTGKSAFELSTSPSNEFEVARLFDKWLSGAPKNWIFVGANPCFDFTFLHQLSTRTGIAFPLNRKKFDIQTLALALWSTKRLRLREFSGVPMLNVDSLAEAFNIKRSGDLHEALEDVRLEKKIMEKLLAL